MKSLVLIVFIYFFIRNIKKIRKYKKKNLYWYKIKEINKFVLGSSHAFYGFKADKDIINLANPSQTFYYDYLILNKYFEKIEKNIKCFISISYFSFSSKKAWIESDLEKYFYILNLKDFEGKYKIYYLIYRYLPLLKKYFKLYQGRDKSITERIEGHYKILMNNEKIEDKLKYLYKIIEKCQEKNIEVILLTTPFTEEYNEYFPQKDLEKNFYSLINLLRNKYNLKYIDLSHRYDLFLEEDDFYPEDYDHLSKKGSKKLIKYLENIL